MQTTHGKTLGVVGLGSMGMGAASSALRAGVPTWGCDTRPTAREQFAQLGGRAVATPRELAPHCQVVLVLVVNASLAQMVWPITWHRARW
jgi:3-hydroxyisobutyrate dehydrogenase